MFKWVVMMKWKFRASLDKNVGPVDVLCQSQKPEGKHAVLDVSCASVPRLIPYFESVE